MLHLPGPIVELTIFGEKLVLTLNRRSNRFDNSHKATHRHTGRHISLDSAGAVSLHSCMELNKFVSYLLCIFQVFPRRIVNSNRISGLRGL